jgi:hypothetical protein
MFPTVFLNENRKRSSQAILIATILFIFGLSSPVAAQLTCTPDAFVTTDPDITWGTTVRCTLPSTFTAVNPCNSDAVVFNGEMTLLIHQSESSNGDIHFKQQIKQMGTGKGVLVKEYRVFQVSDEEFSTGKPAPGRTIVQNFTNNASFNGQSPNDHFIFQQVIHTTMQSGVTPSLVITLKSCCPGSDGTLKCKPFQ